MAADPTSSPLKKEGEPNGISELKSDKLAGKSATKDSKDKESGREKILKVDKIWDKKTRKFRYVKTAKVKDNQKFGRYVVTVARVITMKGAFEGDYIVELRGRFLGDILSAIYRDVDAISFGTTITLEDNNIKLLYHAYPRLAARLEEARRSPNQNEDLVFELEVLISFIESHFATTMKGLKNLHPSAITFDYLWTLFPPNVMCIDSDDLGQDRVHQVLHGEYKKRQDGSVYFDLSMTCLDSDGHSTGFAASIHKPIEGFRGVAPIVSLVAFPFHLHPEHMSLRELLKIRGERLLALRGRHLQEYKGHALGLPVVQPNNADEEEELWSRAEKASVVCRRFNSFKAWILTALLSHGRVMIDPKVFNDLVPRNRMIPFIGKQIADEDLTDELKMMFNPVLYGFSLGDKRWGAFAVSRINDVVWNDTIIDSLVLPKDRKDFIQALVGNHGLKDKEARFDDFVQDKGKGLIGLLSGPPGVGKTLTAEAVAEIARRPLYTVTSGELGNDSISVQNRLASLFKMTEVWNAVVLLDEADVFLAKRNESDLARNAITSVFLRHLEYYQGIMLLTTNRIETMDDAFESRIHFCFEYNELDEATRREIWQKFVDLAKANKALDVRLDESAIEALAKLNINGRQIKNCMSISQAVSIEKAAPLDSACVNMAVGFCRAKP